MSRILLLFFILTDMSLAKAEQLNQRWTINFTESLNDLQEVNGPDLSCRSRSYFDGSQTLAEAFCSDPYEVICGKMNEENSRDNKQLKSDVLFKADKEVALASRPFLGTSLTKEQLNLNRQHMAKSIEAQAWARLGTTPLEVISSVRSYLGRDILDEVELRATEKNRVLKTLNATSFSSVPEEISYDNLKSYHELCGSIKFSYNLNPEYTSNSALVSYSEGPSGTAPPSKLVICPGPIYSALALRPNKNPVEAFEKYYLFALAHEFGHSIDPNRLDSKHKLSPGCYDRPEKSYSAEQIGELVGDYWGANALAVKVSEDVKKHGKDFVVKEWFQRSYLSDLCNSTGSDKKHPAGRARIETLLRNSKIRKALGCEPVYLGERSCDIMMVK